MTERETPHRRDDDAAVETLDEAVDRIKRQLNAVTLIRWSGAAPTPTSDGSGLRSRP